jgi:hypothetical protein
MSDTSKQDRIIIFESCGWRDAADVAKRLKTSLWGGPRSSLIIIAVARVHFIVAR